MTNRSSLFFREKPSTIMCSWSVRKLTQEDIQKTLRFFHFANHTTTKTHFPQRSLFSSSSQYHSGTYLILFPSTISSSKTSDVMIYLSSIIDEICLFCRVKTINLRDYILDVSVKRKNRKAQAVYSFKGMLRGTC
jgi:hypothetical protein